MCGHEGDWSGEAWNPWGHVIPKCFCHLGFCFCYIVCCLVTDKHLFDQRLPESQFLWGWYCGLTSSGATWWKGLCPALVWTWFVPTQIFVETRSSVQRGGRSLGESVFSSQASCCNSVSLPHAPACLPTSSSRTWAECWGHALGSRTLRQIDTAGAVELEQTPAWFFKVSSESTGIKAWVLSTMVEKVDKTDGESVTRRDLSVRNPWTNGREGDPS